MVDRVARQLQRGATCEEPHPDLPMTIGWRHERDGSPVGGERWRLFESDG
jgi:hypothetical protein